MKGFSGKQVFIAGCSLGGCISVNAIQREVRPEAFLLSACLQSRRQYVARPVLALPWQLPQVPHAPRLPILVLAAMIRPCEFYVQGKLFKGAALFAPMLSLERASQHGLNYYLR